MSDLRSVTACARALGIPRQRLDLLLSETKVARIRKGRESLVDFVDAQAAVQNAAAAGRIKGPRRAFESAQDQLIARLTEESTRQKAQIETLLDKVEGYEILKAENRLLKGELEKKGAEPPQKAGILSRLDKALQTFRG